MALNKLWFGADKGMSLGSSSSTLLSTPTRQCPALPTPGVLPGDSKLPKGLG